MSSKVAILPPTLKKMLSDKEKEGQGSPKEGGAVNQTASQTASATAQEERDSSSPQSTDSDGDPSKDAPPLDKGAEPKSCDSKEKGENNLILP